MKTAILIASLTLTAAPALAQNTITLSCERGPTRGLVIVDRGNPIFFESLVDYGYSPERASAFINQICRDERYVNNLEDARTELLRLIAISPPGS